MDATPGTAAACCLSTLHDEVEPDALPGTALPGTAALTLTGGLDDAA